MASLPTVERQGWLRRARRWVVWPYRLLIGLIFLFSLLQAVLAGQFLSGVFGALQMHQNTAALIDMVLIVAIPSALLLRWPGRGPLWPTFATAAMLGLTSLQNWAGFGRLLALHIPLGVAILVVALALTAWAWQPYRAIVGRE